jgi:hypothetical protein
VESILLIAGLAAFGWALTRFDSWKASALAPAKPADQSGQSTADASSAGRGDTKGEKPAPIDPSISVPIPTGGADMDKLKQAIDGAMLAAGTAASPSAASRVPFGAEPGISNPERSPTDFAMQLGIEMATSPNRTPKAQPAIGEGGYMQGPDVVDELLPLGPEADRLTVVDDFAVDAGRALQADPNIHLGRTGNADPFAGF